MALASSLRPRSTFQHPVAFLWSSEATRFRVGWTRHSIAASFSLLSSLAYTFDCSVTCGFICAVDGADYALTDRDLSAGGACFFGMTAVDVPVLGVGSSTPRPQRQETKVNVDMRYLDTGQNYQGREISVRNKKQGTDIAGGLDIGTDNPEFGAEVHKDLDPWWLRPDGNPCSQHCFNTSFAKPPCAVLRHTLVTIRSMTCVALTARHCPHSMAGELPQVLWAVAEINSRITASA